MSHTTSHDGAHEKEMNVSLGASQGMREEERFVRQENGRVGLVFYVLASLTNALEEL